MTTVTPPPAPPASAPSHRPAGAAGPGVGPRRGPGAAGWRQWRAPAVLVALILLGGVLIALIQAGPAVTGPLDPNDTGPQGTHALAALLANRGQSVSRAGSVPDALSQAVGGTTLVVTSPALLSRQQLASLARLRAGLVLVAPGQAALTALAPAVTVAGEVPVFSTPPRCTLPGALLAGSAYMGGESLHTTAPGAWRCYPARPLPGAHGAQAAATPALPAPALPAAGGPAAADGTSLVRYTTGGHTVTVLGTGTALTNQYLATDGNAALALNLLNTSARVVWLVPPPAPGAAAPAGSRSLTSLVPSPVYLVVAELGIALLLAVAWRMRRFGPLVAEPLPVVVRASETVEGHGRLYRARRARDRAAGALRAATLARITTRLGLPRVTPRDAVCAELAARTGRDPGEIGAVLFGPVPGDDGALVSLASELDILEGQVLNP